ncbi:MAG: DnaJ domain-containing protein [Bacilli bacterium]|nr:DnaJ domain-containing protein [Bacilli bacterium]
MKNNEKSNIDYNHNYYYDLGVSEDASISEIRLAFRKLMDAVSNDSTLSDKDANMYLERLTFAYHVLTDEEERTRYDKIRKERKVTNEIVRRKKGDVKNNNSDIERDLDTGADVSKKTSNIPFYICAGVLGAAIITTGILAYEAVKLKNSINDETTTVSDDNTRSMENQDLTQSDQTSDFNNQLDDSNDDIVTQEESVPVVEEVQEVEEDIETKIARTTDEAYSVLQQNTDDTIKYSFDRDTVEALVRYANGERLFTNEYSYEQLYALAQNGVDISMFYKDAVSYDNIKNLDYAMLAINENNNTYDDEYNAYKAIDLAIDSMDQNNFAEVIAIRAAIDANIDRNSMAMLRDGALENGNEGETYYQEKASIDSAKKEECKRIYNDVDLNNADSAIMQATYKALDADSELVRSR